MQRTYISRAFFVLSLLLVPASALSSMDFYRVQGPYNSEPRPDRNWLSTLQADVYGGWADNGKNGSKAKTGALNIYGLHDMASAVTGVNVTGKNVGPLLKVAAIPNVPANGNFGKLLFTGYN